MPSAWANQATWTVLDTDFQDGQHFLKTWLCWQRDPQRSRILHYVGIASVAPTLSPPYRNDGASCDMPQGWQALIGRCKDIGLGFHRFLLDGGSVSLTLCIGDGRKLLSEHVFQADSVFATGPADKWAAQLLARRCKRGTRLCMRVGASDAVAGKNADTHPMALLEATGFQWDEAAAGQRNVTGIFNPGWNIPTSRLATQPMVKGPARCAVVGAGIAGASVAHALAVRGWDVTVFDSAPSPAGGASGLPVGLAVSHVSVDDNPRARLSRSGGRLLAQHADRLLVRGQDWDPCGVLEHRPDGGKLWHPTACWIKPARLVQAWLAHPGVRFVGSSAVVELQNCNGLWRLRDHHRQDLGQFEVVVLANAMGSAALLGKQPALQAVHGTLSFGSYVQAIPGLPSTPVNGNGCLIPHVPGADGDRWFAGSTFETVAQVAADSRAQHAANMARLAQLLAMDAADGTDWSSLLDQAPVGQWSSTRCVTHDRLPLVGPVDTGPSTGLWMCVGMGSRGLSFSALCAELLAARLGGEPLPIEFSLSRSLDVNRAGHRSTTKVDA